MISPNEKDIHVCYVLDELRQGGTELRLLRLLEALPKYGISPSLILLRNECSILREKVKCPVLDLNLRSIRSLKLLRTSRLLYQFLRDQRVEVLEPYFFDSIMLSVPIARLAGIRSIIRTSFNMGHSISFSEKVMYRFLKPLFSHTITNSEQGRIAAKKNFGLKDQNVTVLPNGIELNDFLKIHLDNGRPKQCFHIGMVANLRPVKGVADFIEAASLLSRHFNSVRFSVAGAGSEFMVLEKMVERLGLSPSFEFKGTLSNIPEYLASLDIAVLASHAEGMSNALIEYMAASRPVVATNVGGAAELIGDCVRGLLVEPRQPYAIFEAIQEVINNYDIAAQKAVAAQDFVASRYSVDRMARDYGHFYREQSKKTGARYDAR